MSENFTSEGEEVLAALGQAMRTRQPELLRAALRYAGNFLLVARNNLPPGGHDPLICTRISARIRTIHLAPTGNFL